MPIPILFIGIAVATGAVGIGKTTKAGFDQYNAKKLNENSDERMEEAANRLKCSRGNLILRTNGGRSRAVYCYSQKN